MPDSIPLPLSLLLLSQRASVCIKITFFYWIQYFNSDAARLFEWGSAEGGGGSGGAGLAGIHIYTYILFHGCLNFKITSDGGIAHRHVAQQQQQQRRQQKQQPEERQGVRQRDQVVEEGGRSGFKCSPRWP